MSKPTAAQQSDSPSWLELESIKLMPEVEEITSLSEDTVKRRYPHWIVRLSDRRVGMKLKHALAIASGRGTEPTS